MDQFDRELKRRAQEEPFPLPDSFVRRLRETCDSLEEAPRRKPERRCLSHWGAWFAAAAASLLVVLPNVSASAAEALEQVPVLGPLVQVVTLRNYLYDDGHSFANVSVPQVQEGGQAAALSTRRYRLTLTGCSINSGGTRRFWPRAAIKVWT